MRRVSESKARIRTRAQTIIFALTVPAVSDRNLNKVSPAPSQGLSEVEARLGAPDGVPPGTLPDQAGYWTFEIEEDP